MEDLRWLGLQWDEGVDCGGAYGPYRQTDRYEQYREQAERLIERNLAFRCFCSEEELADVRRGQMARGEMPRYSGKCRALTPGEIEALRTSGKPSVLRLH